MNDRFKFRVWDVRKKKYYDWRKSDVELVLSLDYGLLEQQIDSMRTGSYSNYTEEECYIIEQCTGLADKNGKMIYEGDILKHENLNIGHVRFEHCEFITKGANNDKALAYLSTLNDFDVEIIGNIHEVKL